MRGWGILLVCLSAIWALAVLACCVEDGGPTVWDLMTKSPTERREIQEHMREHYVWADWTFRLGRWALGALILGVVLYAIG